jgi:hypothetical protein
VSPQVGSPLLISLFRPCPARRFLQLLTSASLAGSLAAGVQSSIGNVAAGSLFAAAQSAAAGGGGLAGATGGFQAVTGVVAAIAGWRGPRGGG